MDPTPEKPALDLQKLSFNREQLSVSSGASLAYFFKELDILLDSGVSVTASLKALYEIETNPAVKRFLADAIDAEENDGNASGAVDAHVTLLGPLVSEMLKSSLRPHAYNDFRQIVQMISESPEFEKQREAFPICRVTPAQKDFFLYLQYVCTCEIASEEVFRDMASKCEEPYRSIAQDLADSAYLKSPFEVLQRYDETFDAVTLLLLRCGDQTIERNQDSISESHLNMQEYLMDRILRRP